jgi:hypothetical protein
VLGQVLAGSENSTALYCLFCLSNILDVAVPVAAQVESRHRCRRYSEGSRVLSCVQWWCHDRT